MSAYRVALVFCRAIIIYLWASAGLYLVTELLLFLAENRGWFGSRSMMTPQSLWWSGGSVIAQVVLAITLQIFAPTLSAALTGGALLEGEAIAPYRGLNKDESALANAGAGLILLIFALVGVLPTIASYSYVFFSGGGLGRGKGYSLAIYDFTSRMVGATLQVGAGLLLAFYPAMRRLVKPQSQSENPSD